MNSCRTCKHWECPDVIRAYTKSSTGCKPIRGSIYVGIDQGQGYDIGRATVDYIDTPPDFGCVLWEQIADEPAKETA